MVSKKLAQEIMPIGLVLIALNHKFCRRPTTLHVNTLALRTLLREYGGDHRIAKLELPLQSKQTLSTSNQRAV